MLSITLATPQDCQKQIAERFRLLRVFRDLRRSTLAKRSGVPEPTIKRFELTGEISLRSLLLLAHTLSALDQFDHLFALPVASSLDEIEKRDRQLVGSLRKRGRK